MGVNFDCTSPYKDYVRESQLTQSPAPCLTRTATRASDVTNEQPPDDKYKRALWNCSLECCLWNEYRSTWPGNWANMEIDLLMTRAWFKSSARVILHNCMKLQADEVVIARFFIGDEDLSKNVYATGESSVCGLVHRDKVRYPSKTLASETDGLPPPVYGEH
ncbi:hypothetical protein AVEN_212162-1 [Araneus ventricosus]|uniref:Uncharacterized protein n=1 Tax=Araneus ventricosus TaxID=182803 RepID=A0A4Y2HBZ7_ARAVE|nr:hypothetical protein AVEN_212162-1 [Araneus ventricosus]